MNPQELLCKKGNLLSNLSGGLTGAVWYSPAVNRMSSITNEPMATHLPEHHDAVPNTAENIADKH